MSNFVKKPTRLFCKYGYVSNEQIKGEEHMYNFGTTIKERCDKFYSNEEIKQMENEVKNPPQAECVICSNPIIIADNCSMCEEYHKFHTKCLKKWWNIDSAMEYRCPLHTREVTTWKSPCPCTVTDWYGGGKKRLKKSKKARKSRKIKKKTKRSTRKKKCNKKKRLIITA